MFAYQHQNRWFLPLAKITYSFAIQAEPIFIHFMYKATKPTRVFKQV